MRAAIVAAVLGFAATGQAQAVDGDDHAMHHMHHMAGVLGLTHAREASGTSWQPDATPIYADHFMVADWMLMTHYLLFGVFDDMYGPRGGSTLMSINWGMAMARRELGGGQLQLRAMVSLEPFTVPSRGYPLLLQTGEAYDGQPLHDVQHPHDLFMEVSAAYARELAHGVAAQIYVAPVGEPALGPTAFSHRESAALSPLAPLSHHFLDSTHVSFGVATLAAFTHEYKVEVSAFNGHEPDQHRVGFDKLALNSWSVRGQWAPCPGFAAQISYGHLDSPEELAPGVNQDRFTASGTVDHRFGDGNAAFTLAYGHKSEGGDSANAVLAELNLDADGNNNFFTRFEWMQRAPEELALGPGFSSQLPIAEAQIGYLYETDPIGRVRAGVGAVGMLAFVPSELENLYGGSAAPGLAIFLRLRPGTRY